MTWRLLAAGPLAPADFALTWVIQSTTLLALCLLAGRLLKRTGLAIQSACYRTTLLSLLGTLLAGLVGVGGRNAEVLGDGPKDEKPQTAVESSRKALRKTVTEAKDVPITGRIVDLEGRPVVGATVRIMSYAIPRTGDLTLWLDAVRNDQPPTIARQHLDFAEVPATAPLKATTDQQGRFRFARFGSEQAVHMLLEGPTIASSFFTVVTRPIEFFPPAVFSQVQVQEERSSTGPTSRTPPLPAGRSRGSSAMPRPGNPSRE